MQVRFCRFSRATQRLTLSLLLGGCAVAIGAQPASEPAPDTAALQQRIAAELRATVTALAESGAFGNTPVDQAQLDLRLPAQRVNDLGLLVDSSSPRRDGVLVLGVTPGEQAEAIGVRSGDLITEVNGHSLTQHDRAAAQLRQLIDAMPDRGELSLTVLREGQPRTLRGTLNSVHLPPIRLVLGSAALSATADPPVATATAADGCGRISDFDVAPRQQHLHAARVLSIDGQLPGPTNSHVFRVKAGPHTLEVSEQIQPRYLPFSDRFRRAGAGFKGSKTLKVDVPVDTTLQIAARLNPEQLHDWRNAAYWDPVVWHRVNEACR